MIKFLLAFLKKVTIPKTVPKAAFVQAVFSVISYSFLQCTYNSRLSEKFSVSRLLKQLVESQAAT
jgi:hypothetical protein